MNHKKKLIWSLSLALGLPGVGRASTVVLSCLPKSSGGIVQSVEIELNENTLEATVEAATGSGKTEEYHFDVHVGPHGRRGGVGAPIGYVGIDFKLLLDSWDDLKTDATLAASAGVKPVFDLNARLACVWK